MQQGCAREPRAHQSGCHVAIALHAEFLLWAKPAATASSCGAPRFSLCALISGLQASILPGRVGHVHDKILARVQSEACDAGHDFTLLVSFICSPTYCRRFQTCTECNRSFEHKSIRRALLTFLRPFVAIGAGLQYHCKLFQR